MSKIEIGNMLKGTAKIASDSVKGVAHKVEEKGIADSVKGVAQKAGNAAKQGTGYAVGTVKTAISKKEAEKETKEKEDAKYESETIAISPENAMKVFYYLMAADGEVSSVEEEKFDSVGIAIDENYLSNKDKIVSECKLMLVNASDYEAIKSMVNMALEAEQMINGNAVSPKLLVWDLLTIAYGDNEYKDSEKELICYIAEKLNVPKDIFLEMENSYLSITDLQKELAWIKTTNRPYVEIESHVKELEKRIQVIFESVKALIVL